MGLELGFGALVTVWSRAVRLAPERAIGNTWHFRETGRGLRTRYEVDAIMVGTAVVADWPGDAVPDPDPHGAGPRYHNVVYDGKVRQNSVLAPRDLEDATRFGDTQVRVRRIPRVGTGLVLGKRRLREGVIGHSGDEGNYWYTTREVPVYQVAVPGGSSFILLDVSPRT